MYMIVRPQIEIMNMFFEQAQKPTARSFFVAPINALYAI